MFKIYHQQTHYEWTVLDKDELLSELDILNRRHYKRKTSEVVLLTEVVNHVEGMTYELSLPTTQDIDDLLSDFGNNILKGKPSILDRFKSFVFNKEKDTKESDQPFYSSETNYDELEAIESNDKTKDTLVVEDIDKNTTDHQQDEMSGEDKSQSNIEHILNDFRQHKVDTAEDHSILENQVNDSHTIDSAFELNQNNMGNSDNDYTNNQLEIQNNQSTIEDEVYDTTLSKSQQDKLNIHKSELPVDNVYLTQEIGTIQKNETVSPKEAIYRTIESIGTYDLQQEMVQRVAQEITNIDKAIEMLQDKKAQHQKLLLSIEQFKIEM